MWEGFGQRRVDWIFELALYKIKQEVEVFQKCLSSFTVLKQRFGFIDRQKKTVTHEADMLRNWHTKDWNHLIFIYDNEVSVQSIKTHLPE